MTRFGGRYWSRRSCLSAVSLLVCVLVAFYIWQPPGHSPAFNFNINDKPLSAHPYETSLPEPSTDFINLIQHPDLPSAPYNPYPAYNSLSWRTRWLGKYHACEGPQGPNGNTLSARPVSLSAPNPQPLVGSYEELGLDNSYCFDREGRLNAYGFGEEKAGAGAIDWDKADWGSLQDQCIDKNTQRFEQDCRETAASPFQLPNGTLPDQKPDSSHNNRLRPRLFNRKYSTRKAVLIRSWDTKKYNPEVTQHIRSMIAELSLHSGGEYAVYLVVEVKKPSLHIHNSTDAYQSALHEFVPKEFQNITLLFNQPMLDAWYPDIPAGGQIWHMNQPVQLFSLFNPQFTHVWDIELDVRYTANWYSILSSSTDWARTQPRKYQWERAEKFYLPTHYNSYANFTASIASSNPSGGVWGPVFNPAIPTPIGPTHPVKKDDWTWGVGEEADDIALAPIIDLTPSEIFVNNTNTGFPPNTQRRALMTTPVKAHSRRLLRAMHDAQVGGLDMRSEMFAHNIALAHGLKVAVVPLPMFSANDTTAGELEESWTGSGVEKAPDRKLWTQGLKGYSTFWWKVYGVEHYPRQLFRQWYGGGKTLEEEVKEKLCLPGILLHPVKEVM